MANTNNRERSPTISFIPIVPEGSGGMITEFKLFAVRTECGQKPEDCRQNKEGPMCWDPVKVMDATKTPTTYNRRALICGGTAKGRRMIDAIKEEDPVRINPFPKPHRRARR